MAESHGALMNVSSFETSNSPSRTGDITLPIFIMAVRVVLTQCVCLVGLVTNTLSIITFISQKLGDTVNISLLSLALSDLLSLLTLFWLNLCYAPEFQAHEDSFIPLEVAYLTGGWPQVFFTRITTWITVYITLEKCFCIVVPMKVKAVFTRRRTVIYNILVYVVILASVAPIYYTARFTEKFFTI